VLAKGDIPRKRVAPLGMGCTSGSTQIERPLLLPLCLSCYRLVNTEYVTERVIFQQSAPADSYTSWLPTIPPLFGIWAPAEILNCMPFPPG